jgi:thiazole synthase
MPHNPATESRPTLTVNGEPRPLPDPPTVAGLLAEMKLKPDVVAVELNKRLVRSPDYDRGLSTGDTIEIVTFVGGG